MAQGQLGLYGPCPTEIRSAALRFKARVYDLGPDVQRPAEHQRGRLGERGGAGRRWTGVREPSIRESAECSLIGLRRTAAEYDRTSHMLSGHMGWTGRSLGCRIDFFLVNHSKMQFYPARIQTVLRVLNRGATAVAHSPLNQTRVSRVLCDWTTYSRPTIDRPPEDTVFGDISSLHIFISVCRQGAMERPKSALG
jgi:hypothetical protein